MSIDNGLTKAQEYVKGRRLLQHYRDLANHYWRKENELHNKLIDMKFGNKLGFEKKTIKVTTIKFDDGSLVDEHENGEFSTGKWSKEDQ